MGHMHSMMHVHICLCWASGHAVCVIEARAPATLVRCVMHIMMHMYYFVVLFAP